MNESKIKWPTIKWPNLKFLKIKWMSDEAKIGFLEVSLLVVLNMILPTADVFTDIKSSATFFLTGRNCYYTNNGTRNWTYSECHILPTLTRLDWTDYSINAPGGSSGFSSLKSPLIEKEDEAQEPTKLVYVNYNKIGTEEPPTFKYALDALNGWTPFSPFLAFKAPVNGSMPLHVGVSDDLRAKVQKEKWIPSDGWTEKPLLQCHVLKDPREGMKMYTVSHARDGRSRILDRPCEGQTNSEEWTDDFSFWAKEVLRESAECCDTVAVLSYGNASTWRTEYLGKYTKETEETDPCNVASKQIKYVQKHPENENEIRTNGHGWFIGRGLEEFAISGNKMAVGCPNEVTEWTYATDTKSDCSDNTLITVCISQDEDLSSGNPTCKDGVEDGSVEFKCIGTPYIFFGWAVIIPTILTTLVTLKLWWETEETAKCRLLTFPLLLLQIWPQYRAALIIIYGLQSNKKWQRLKDQHNSQISSIEPTYESVLQVNVMGCILITTAGPWYDNINALYSYPLATSLSSFAISLFTASFGIAKFLLVGPLRILPDGLLNGHLTWTFFASFLATLSTVFIKAFWFSIIVNRIAKYENIYCGAWELENIEWKKIVNAIGVGISVYYVPNIMMALFILVVGFGIRKTLSIVSRIPVLIFVPAFSPFTFGHFNSEYPLGILSICESEMISNRFKRSPHLSFSRSLTFINTTLFLLQCFLPPYVFMHYTDTDGETHHWFYTANPLLYTHHTTLMISLAVCLPLVVVPTLLLLTPHLPSHKPHLCITTLNVDTWKNEENEGLEK